jgi:predicted Zn-dependent peptidase
MARERILMRTLRFAAVAAVAACVLFALSCQKNDKYSQHFNKASDEHFKRDMSDLTSFKLANGITVYLQEEHTTQEVAIEAVYRAGYITDPKGKIQLAHLTEHMLMRCASGPYKAGETMSLVMDKKDMISAEAVADFIHVDYVVDASRLDATLAIEASRMTSLLCDDDVLKAQKKDVVDEFANSLKEEKGNLSKLSLGALSHVMYYGETNVPMIAAVSKLTLDDVKSFHDSHYTSDHMVLVMIGNFKKADAEALVRKHFESIPARGALPDPTFVINRSTKASWDVPAHVSYFLAPGPFDPKERLILTMFGAFLAQLLQNSPDVYQNVQAVYSSNQSYPVGRLPFFIFLQGRDGDTTEKAVPALFARVDQAVQALDDDKRVELVKTGMVSFITSSGLKADQPDFPIMHYQIIGQEALTVCLKHMLLDGRSADEFAAQVQAITPEEFRAVVKKRLDRSKLLTVSFDPRG